LKAGFLWSVALFAGLDGRVEPILLGWQRAGGVGGVSARGILKPVEVEHQRAGLIEPVVGNLGVEKAAARIGGAGAGGIAQDEQQGARLWIFEHGLKLHRIAVEQE